MRYREGMCGTGYLASWHWVRICTHQPLYPKGTNPRIHRIGQSRHTDGTRAQNGTRHSLLSQFHFFFPASISILWRIYVCMYTVGHATTNECYNEVFINKIRMPQRTRRNTIGRRSTRVRMTCQAFPLRLERQSSSFLSFVRFSYQFSSFICLLVQCTKVKLINFILFLYLYLTASVV